MKSLKNLSFVFSVLSFCLLYHTGIAQHTFIQKAEHAVAMNSSIASITTSDGGVLMATGIYAPISNIRIGVLIVKYNPIGEITWSHSYYTYIGDFVNLGLVESKGSFIVGGLLRSEAGFNKQFMIRMDANGSVAWAKTFELPGSAVAASYDISTFSNGDILFHNITLESGSSGNQWPVMCRIDTAGNVLWTKHYHYTAKYGYAMITSDDRIILQHPTMEFDPVTVDYKNALIMTDGSGNILWSKNISDIDDGIRPVEINSKKLLLPLYQTATHTFSLLCIDDQGNILWKTELFPGNPSRILKTSDGNILVVSNNTSFYLFDQSGNFLKMNQVNLPLPPGQSSVSEVCGNQFMAFGVSSTSLLSYKINPDLKSMCSDASTFTTLAPINYTGGPVVSRQIGIQNVAQDLFLWSAQENFSMEMVCENKECEKINLGSDTIICGANSMILNYTPGPVRCNTQRQFLWSTGETSSSIKINNSGKYWVEMSEDLCSSRDTIEVLFDKSILELGNSSVLCSEKNESRLLSAPGFIHYKWSTGDSSASIEVSKAGQYVVSARSLFGCDYSDTVVIYDECPPELYMPEIFSPNGDGKNDVFKPTGKYIKHYHLQVFNRWGNVVYESNDPSSGWDGKDAAEGIYVWMVNYAGTYQNNEIHKKMKGTVYLTK